MTQNLNAKEEGQLCKNCIQNKGRTWSLNRHKGYTSHFEMGRKHEREVWKWEVEVKVGTFKQFGTEVLLFFTGFDC